MTGIGWVIFTGLGLGISGSLVSGGLILGGSTLGGLGQRRPGQGFGQRSRMQQHRRGEDGDLTGLFDRPLGRIPEPR